ncbi:MAG TPA: IS110 family transposase [Burkholderiales bacterium]|nr:IS110 family transposase [Burkholderiales bacterium]
MSSMQIGVDLAKAVFEVAVSTVPGQVQERRRLSRTALTRFLAARPPAEVLLEACGSAHHWGREFRRLGHTVALLPASAVARYRDGNKTDRADAKALLEAARNTKIRRVPVKSVEQQAVVALHRLRQGYLRTRTARINAVRGHLREFGCVIPVGAAQVLPRAHTALDQDAVPALLRPALQIVLEEIAMLEAKADTVRTELTRLADHMPDAQLLLSVPGVGVLTATALVAFVGDIHRFRSGRHFAAYLGLTPREHSSGHVRRLGSITKRGNPYLRMLLIHGARSALRAGAVSRAPDDLRTWARTVAVRKGHNVAAVALANKLARVCWRVWCEQRPFERREPR